MKDGPPPGSPADSESRSPSGRSLALLPSQAVEPVDDLGSQPGRPPLQGSPSPSGVRLNRRRLNFPRSALGPGQVDWTLTQGRGRRSVSPGSRSRQYSAAFRSFQVLPSPSGAFFTGRRGSFAGGRHRRYRTDPSCYSTKVCSSSSTFPRAARRETPVQCLRGTRILI